MERDEKSLQNLGFGNYVAVDAGGQGGSILRKVD